MDRAAIYLEHAGQRKTEASFESVNRAMSQYGCKVWPLDLALYDSRIRSLVAQTTLTTNEDSELREAFLLTREEVLDKVAEAGRVPNVEGGGEMSTIDATHDVVYPELYLVEPGVDYSRFDRLHRNVADSGTGVDEIMQILSGQGVRIVQSLPNEGRLTIYLDCSDDQGWIVTYSGAFPHIGSLTDATVGTKVLMQILGPPVWYMRYEE